MHVCSGLRVSLAFSSGRFSSVDYEPERGFPVCSAMELDLRRRRDADARIVLVDIARSIRDGKTCNYAGVPSGRYLERCRARVGTGLIRRSRASQRLTRERLVVEGWKSSLAYPGLAPTDMWQTVRDIQHVPSL